MPRTDNCACLPSLEFTFVMYNSLENILSNKLQVIVFEKMDQNYLKVDRFSLMFWNQQFQWNQKNLPGFAGSTDTGHMSKSEFTVRGYTSV